MATILKGFKLKLYPTTDQQILFRRTFGCTRFVWNQLLAMQKKRYKNNPEKWFISQFGMDKLLPLLKQEHPWLKEIDATALQMATAQLADAYIRFFKGQNGFPHFRKLPMPKVTPVSMSTAISKSWMTIISSYLK